MLATAILCLMTLSAMSVPAIFCLMTMSAMSYGCVCCIMSSAALLIFLEQNSLMLHQHKPECLVTFGSVVMCGCNVSSVVAAFPC